MNRRKVIILLGGAAAAWPLAARAQQRDRVRRIGILMALAADDPAGQARLVAFVQALQELGWTNGRNARIDTRWAAGDAERFRRYAAELVALAPDVILASGGTGVGALLQASRTVPIVFTQTQSVRLRWIACARRERNYRRCASGIHSDPVLRTLAKSSLDPRARKSAILAAAKLIHVPRSHHSDLFDRFVGGHAAGCGRRCGQCEIRRHVGHVRLHGPNVVRDGRHGLLSAQAVAFGEGQR